MQTTTYNPDLDPARVDELTVRRLVPAEVRGAKIVAQGRFQKGGRGAYAAVAVVVLWDNAPFAGTPYSVHTLVIRSEAEGLGEHYLVSGEYDLTLEAARTALAAR